MSAPRRAAAAFSGRAPDLSIESSIFCSRKPDPETLATTPIDATRYDMCRKCSTLLPKLVQRDKYRISVSRPVCRRGMLAPPYKQHRNRHCSGVARRIGLRAASGTSSGSCFRRDVIVEGRAARLVREQEGNVVRPSGLLGYEHAGEPIGEDDESHA